MAKSEKAAAAIAALHSRKPDATLDQFLAAAINADASVDGMPKRSFNATYLLPLKRAAAPKKKKRTSSKPAPRPGARRTRKVKAAANVAPAPTRRARTAAANVNGSSDGASAARQLVLQRDQELLAALRSGGDPQAAYALAASVDDFVASLVTALHA